MFNWPWRAWMPLFITLLIQALVTMALLTLPVMAPVVAKANGISPTLVGVYVSLSYIGAILASLMSGATVIRFGPIRVSQLGLLVCALGLALCAVPWLPLMVVGAVLVGLGYGPMTPASSHLLARSTPPQQMSLVFSLKQTGVPLGGMLAGAVVPPLLLWVDWQASLLIVSALCVLCALLSQTQRNDLDSDRQPHQVLRWGNILQPIRLVFSHRALATLAICSFMFSVVQMSLMTYLVTYLHDELVFTLVGAGLAMTLTQFGGVIGRVLWGYVADRWVKPLRMLSLLAFTMSCTAGACAFFSPDTSPVWLYGVLGLFGATAIGWNGVYLSEVARQAPKGMASMATGGTLAVTFLGVVFGSPIIGWISNISGSYRSGFLALSALAMTCFALLTWLSRARRS
ncbi:MAG: MFS transporter [Betaproteobacteria bacterium]|jgi:MFS family permease|nr:MFS transporter [Betaproteobacteria bacterium]